MDDMPLIAVDDMTDVSIIFSIAKISGIVTQQGGMTCHAAILAREFNLPTVVGCAKLLDRLTGLRKYPSLMITVNGNTGQVTLDWAGD